MTTAERLKQLMEGATRGPWVVGRDKQPNADERLIVASVNLLPALAAVVEAVSKIPDNAAERLRAAYMQASADAVEEAQAALSALDAAVAREVG